MAPLSRYTLLIELGYLPVIAIVKWAQGNRTMYSTNKIFMHFSAVFLLTLNLFTDSF